MENKGHENLRILQETTFEEFPQKSIEHFVKGALEEWDSALREIELLREEVTALESLITTLIRSSGGYYDFNTYTNKTS